MTLHRMVPTIECLDEILKRDHCNKKRSDSTFRMLLFIILCKVVITFECVDKSLQCVTKVAIQLKAIELYVTWCFCFPVCLFVCFLVCCCYYCCWLFVCFSQHLGPTVRSRKLSVTVTPILRNLNRKIDK